MKSWLLPLTTTLGAVGAVTLMLATQAAPAPENSAGATRQIRQMEHQSRLREWSRGLGIDLTGSPLAARAENAPMPAADAPRMYDRTRTNKRARDDAEHREPGDRHDRRKQYEHEEDDETAS